MGHAATSLPDGKMIEAIEHRGYTPRQSSGDLGSSL